MMIHHLTLAVRGRRSLVEDESQRRGILRAVLSTLGVEALVFALLDDHLHALLRSDLPGYRARDVRRVIQTRRPELDLKRAHLEEVGTRAYLNSVVRYVLRQPQKHGLPGHPALWSGSCFQDLVGARLLPGFQRTALLTELPRFKLREAFEVVGLSGRPLIPCRDEDLALAGAGKLAELAAGVFGVGPTLLGRSRGVVEARVLATRLGLRLGIAAVELARYLRVDTRAVRRLATRRLLRPDADRALRLRLALERRAAA